MQTDKTHLKVSSPEVEHNVEEVYKIHEVVKTKPDDNCVGGDFGKTESEHDDPTVVDEGKRNDHGPPVTQVPGRVKHKRPPTTEKRKSELSFTKQADIFEKLLCHFKV